MARPPLVYPEFEVFPDAHGRSLVEFDVALGTSQGLCVGEAKSNSNLGKGGRDTGRELSKLLEGAGLLPATILVLSTSRLSWPGSGGGPLWMELDEPDPGGPGPAVSGELLAYTAVLDDVLFGGSALSVTAEEAEVTWQIVEPVLRSWAAGDVPLLDYAAGSPGPPPLEGTIRR